MKSGSHLEAVLRSGEFAVTAEVAPPKSASSVSIKSAAQSLKGYVHALNLTDNQAAVVRMSSVAACVHALSEAVEPVLHMTCRDRNRIGLQSDLLGAWSLGIKNVLLLTGDSCTTGNHPDAQSVFDLNSIGLCRVVRGMRDHSQFMNGEAMKRGPRFFIGVGENPFGPVTASIERLSAKVSSGADFVQTQPIYDIDAFRRWMDVVRNTGLAEKIFIMGGIIPIKSYAALSRISRVPGIHVPESLLDRFRDIPEERQQEAGIEYALETIGALTDIEDVHGVHIMAINWTDVVPQIVTRAGLVPSASPRVRVLEAGVSAEEGMR